MRLDGRLLNPGSLAPGLPYVRLGDPHSASLAAHRGRIVVLEFWAIGCGPCQKAVADLQKTAAKFARQKDRIDFLTISIDGWASAEQLKDWRIGGLPSVFIIGADGKVTLVNGKRAPGFAGTGAATLKRQ